MNEFFRRFAAKVSRAVGSGWAFILAVTIITFLMVFLIQNTQNRDAKAIHLKLDELIHGLRGPHTGFVDLEDMSDEDLEELEIAFRKLRQKYGLSVKEFVEDVEQEGKGRKTKSKQ